MLIEEGTPHDSGYTVEFRSTKDDAWHPVLLDFVANMLFVTFVEVTVSMEQEEVYGPYSFDTPSKLGDFRTRFRPLSLPMRDVDCTDVQVGMTVCATYNFGNGDWRFYDAVVIAVNRVEHEGVDMEDEECRCDFRIFWKHGPLGGTVTSTRVNNIQLLVPYTDPHPELAAFIDITRQHFQRHGKSVRFVQSWSHRSGNHYGFTSSKGHPSSTRHREDSLPNIGKMSSGELARAWETEKSLHVLGLAACNAATMPSSPPPLVFSEVGIMGNRGMDIEFRSMKDDAWHGVSLHVKPNGKLFLDYNDYTMFSMEETHEPDQFNTLGEIVDFRERFRPLSLHLSPEECHEVKVGNLICVRFDFEGTDKGRFYDSLVKEVVRYEHAVLDGQETCFCSFEIFWKHGPLGGTISIANIDHICVIVPTIVNHPALTTFLDIARWELGRPRKYGRIVEQIPLNLPPGFYEGVDSDNVMLSRGEPSTRDKGKKIEVDGE